MNRFRTTCLLGLWGVIAFAGCSGSPPAETSQRKDEKRDPTPIGPPITVSVNDLHNEYWTKPKETEQKYRGKLLQVSGRVDVASSNNHKERLEVSLGDVSGDLKGLLVSVWCKFPQKAEDQVDQLTRTQIITIRGVCDFDIGNPALSDCELVTIGPDPVIRVAAGELAKEYVADPFSARKKYHALPVLVEGTIADIKEQGDHSRFEVVLEGSLVNIQATSNEIRSRRYRESFAALKKGQTIRLKGTCMMPDAGGILLDGAVVAK